MGLPYLVATAALILSSWTGHLLKAYQVPVLHESSAGTIIGLLIGFAGFILFPGHALQTVGSFDNNLFFNAILPPIIFSAAYSLKKKNFFSNFGSIMAFGILATFMSFAIQSVILISASKNEILYRLGEKEEERGIQLSTLECLLLASVMSSTDSVAALSLLDPQVVPSLCGILSGEAIVNDAVSIVLFRSIISLASKRQRTDGLALSFRFHDVLIIILDFIKNIFSSTIIGFLFGIICAVLLRLQPRQSHPYRDIAILFLFAYLSYELAEALELSGIITLFFCGVAMTHYAWYNIPKHTRFASLMGAKSLGFLAESFLFICLGAYVFRHTSKSDWSPMLAVVIFLAVRILNFVQF